MPPSSPPDLTTYRLGPANPEQHLMAIARMVSDAFAGGQYVEEISQQYLARSHYDWAVTRLAWDGERLVHHWGVWGYPMRLESIQVKVAGVGAVVTDEAYRQRGLMHRAALDSFRAMTEQGYDLTILRGRHYAKYGYVRAWNYVTVRLKPAEIPQRELQQPYQALGPEHMAQINAIYNRDYQPYSGTAVRPTYGMLQPGDMGAYGWFDDQGALTGYVRALPTDDHKTLQCLEATGDPDQGLAVLAGLFKQTPYESLTFFTLPYHHPLFRLLRRGACVVENQYFHHTGWQVRIVNLGGLLRKMIPLLQARLQNSALAHWEGALHLDAGEQAATLVIEGGQVQVTAQPPGEHAVHGGANVARLLIGSDEPDEIIQQAEMECTGQAVELLRVLSPNLHPMLSHFDEY